MVSRILMALVAGAVAYLVCIFLGGLLVLTGVPLVAFVGEFLKQWAVLISILVAIGYFVSGSTWTLWNRA